MTDFKTDINNKVFQNAVKKLQLRFPVSDISGKVGYAKSNISDFLKDKKSVSDDFLDRFAQAYNLNLDDFREDEKQFNPLSELEYVGKGGRKEMNKKSSQLDDIDYPEEAGSFYYPSVTASAGLDIALANNETEKIPVIVPNFGKDVSFINVFGDSMFPKFCGGEIIGIKEIDFPFVNYGYAYVVVFDNGEVYLKYIKKGKDDDHWLLASENKDYEPKEYHLSLIRRVFIIKGVITKTTM